MIRVKYILLACIFVCCNILPTAALAAGTEPALADGVYKITSGDELLWFASAVNGGRTGIDGVLENDIALSGAWTPIGTSSYKYAGRFDGSGYEISGMSDSSSSGTYHGLFGYIASAGQVKNVSVSGTINTTDGSGYVGGIAGYNQGTISGCTTNVLVSGKQYIGGTTGYNTGTITNCINKGKAELPSTYSYNTGVGGIAGYNTGVIEYSANFGDLSNVSNRGYYTGGIAGRVNGSNMRIANSYNMAEVNGYNIVGGIVGGAEGSGKIEYVYSAGEVKCRYSSNSATKGGIAGKASSGMCEYAYFLQDGDINSGLKVSSSGTQQNSGGKTAEELKSDDILPLLGGAYESDSANINDGYPILKWQNPNATYKIEVTVSPEDADVVLTDSEGNAVTGVQNGGVHTFADLKKGEYTCAVSADECETGTKKIIVSAGDVYTTISLEKKRYKTVFEVNPPESKFVLKSGSEVLTAEVNGNIYEYNLESGSYTYSASLFGYAAEEDTITVNRAAFERTINLEKLPSARVKFEFVDRDSQAVLENPRTEVKCGDYIVPSETDGGYMLPVGEYEYTVRKSGYAKAKDSLTVGNDDIADGKTVRVYTYASTVWDGDSDEPENIDGVWQISSGNELAWLAGFANGTVTSDNTSQDAILLNDIDLSDLEWTPIGDTNKYTCTYNGVFDGNGKTISGLNVNKNANNLGLFGKISSTAEIKNLTVRGSVNESGSSRSYVGGIVGYSDGGKISGCVSNVRVTNPGKYTGGICGYSTGTISDCRNLGNIKADGDYAGGISGYAKGSYSKSLSIARCENRGELSYASGTGRYKGGICGYTQYIEISECANLGNVFANGNFAGGVVGQIYSGTTVTDSYNSADVSSDAYSAGGFAGATYGSASNITIKNCYSSGSVKTSLVNCGAFVGLLDGGTIINCQTLIETAPGGVNYGMQAIGKGTSDAISTEINYKLLNTDGKWERSLFYNNKFPYLLWQNFIEKSVSVDGSAIGDTISAGKRSISAIYESDIENAVLVMALYRNNALEKVWKSDVCSISAEYDFNNGDIVKLLFWSDNTPIEKANEITVE